MSSNEIGFSNQRNIVLNDFSQFELLLESVGLPKDNIVAPPEERNRIMAALPDFVGSLSPETKRDARYLSKFIAGSAIGLFDASLNYVWNEVVVTLRNKVTVYGLDIFFDAAVGEKLREQYQSEEDLAGLKDQTLLDTCRKLELISDIIHKKLSHILTMRNDIGASHPNTYSINSYELLGWLTTCINDVLQDGPSRSAITVKSIVDNLKRNKSHLEQEIVESFKRSIKDLSSVMAGNLLTSLYGLFVSDKTEKLTQENILKLAPIVWEHTTDNFKYDLGEKHDNYKAKLDHSRMSYSERFFEECDGKRYYSLDTKSVKLSSLCDDLVSAHNGLDNYYHEPPIVKSIMSFIKKAEDIPAEREEKIINSILTCRIGREVGYRNGVSPGARDSYDGFLKLLNKEQTILVINLMKNPEIRNKLSGSIRRNNAAEILEHLKTPLIGDRLIEIIDYMISSKNHLENVFYEKKFIELTNGII
ncbi:hypothetical protein [Peribacillus frigoritolerans]|uniref:hypothetical protein n=1 Tax=Peribacillus frigoritolerans TaxID=450367 RepID=UPI002E229BC0|nr:hypothetical protein [Peribacillus frigoritolerans]